MDPPAVLAAFDEQMRRHPAESPGVRVEAEDRVTRTVGTDDSWRAVVWSRLTEADADEVAAGEIDRAAGEFEWKLYSHDRPSDLPERLRAAGLTPEPVEMLMVAEIGDLELSVPLLDGIRLAAVDDEAEVATMLAVHDEIFGPGTTHPGVVEGVRTALRMQPRPTQPLIAWAADVAVSAGRIEFHEGTDFASLWWAADVAVSAGRIEFHEGTDFASLWGGGTLPEWRGRGGFHALVGTRALMARERGYRYLQVDLSWVTKAVVLGSDPADLRGCAGLVCG